MSKSKSKSKLEVPELEALGEALEEMAADNSELAEDLEETAVDSSELAEDLEETAVDSSELSDEAQVPDVSIVGMKMHEKLILSGNYVVENLGGGDVYVNDGVLYTGDSISINGDIVLYTTCYPKVKLSKFK
jgi:predicted nuclease with TOPRIM domain